MQYATKLKVGTALLLPLAMAACSDRSDTTTATPPPAPPPPAASIQSQIGTSFAAFFDASNTSDPKDPVASDVPPLSLTTEPITN
jgi:hypothetical protein